ncbi:molybdopterin synthase sulphurylase, putative [Bodo saltans]|uniref:Molybdopterin synthase sulphurylase, putative n=1 Tax=Bodo saltans TaxID=75058 RepID=A0A0S4JY12_BODSA|nr:molybdopterin synthase sulphurylase, putative [Bodo saltans]|eukprot:CUG94029.1 molybdopterin synthase sulphurylase, putative [Bodo saltans]
MDGSNADLDNQIRLAEEHLAALKKRRDSSTTSQSETDQQPERKFGAAALTKDDVERYSRQMLCEDLGPAGTRKLRDATVLVVGAGGLGSTVCLYLAAAGVGTLRIMDFDVVERSNLHRQVIHDDLRIGDLKADSARRSCLALNPHIHVESIHERLDAHNAEKYIAGCDVVVDASDNVASRYLINDAAALCGKPLVSGAAMRWEGQLTVYDRGATTPCYRCLFPSPPPANTVGSCNDTGVVGPVPGMIGCLQALEAVKLIAQCGEPLRGRMLIWNGLTAMFKVVKLRPRQASCATCSTSSQDAANDAVVDRVQKNLWEHPRPEYAMVPCLAPSFDLPASHCVTPAAILEESAEHHVVVDVRDSLQHSMCSIQGSVSVPLKTLSSCATPLERLAVLRRAVSGAKRTREGDVLPAAAPSEVLVVCRRGIASTTAVTLLLEAQTVAANAAPEHEYEGKEFAAVPIKNVVGGLNRYASQCDFGFPDY